MLEAGFQNHYSLFNCKISGRLVKADYVRLKMARERQYFMEHLGVLSVANRTKHHPFLSFCWDIPLLVHSINVHLGR